MTLHKALYPRDDVDRLYVSRREGSRGSASIQDSVDASILRHEDDIKNAEKNYYDQKQYIQYKNQQNKITRKQKWEENQLYGYFKRQTNEILHDKT